MFHRVLIADLLINCMSFFFIEKNISVLYYFLFFLFIYIYTIKHTSEIFNKIKFIRSFATNEKKDDEEFLTNKTKQIYIIVEKNFF